MAIKAVAFADSRAAARADIEVNSQFDLAYIVMNGLAAVVLEVWGAVATANAIAYLSELLDPKNIVLVLTRRNLMQHSLAYALWGEGEVGVTVYSILLRYWQFTKRDSGLPRILLMSE